MNEIDSHNKIFKPLLSNIGNSAIIQKEEIIIGIGRPIKLNEVKSKLLPLTKHLEPLKPPQYLKNGIKNSNNEKEMAKPPKPLLNPEEAIAISIPNNKAKIEAKQVFKKNKEIHQSQPKITQPPSLRRQITTSLTKPVLSPRDSTMTSKEETKHLMILKKSGTSSRSNMMECQLTNEEQNIYGNRFPLGYKKLCLIGKGGYALVWNGKRISNNIKYAIKQFSRSSGRSNIESAKVEISLGTLLMKYKDYPGIKHISKFIDFIEGGFHKVLWFQLLRAFWVFL